MTLVYATRDNLVAYVPAGTVVPDEPEAARLLTSASQVIYRATKTAIYDADTVTGMPTDANILTALQRATCAQALWWILTGDEQGLVSLYEQVSIGSMSLSRRGSRGDSTGVSGQQLAPQAATELIDGRLLAGSLVQSYTWEG